MAKVLLVALVFAGGAEAGFLSRSKNITVVGSVYCDACSNNTFSKHSFFLKGEQSMLWLPVSYIYHCISKLSCSELLYLVCSEIGKCAS
jgi:hypothetical protein